jgi:hypothetical protein
MAIPRPSVTARPGGDPLALVFKARGGPSCQAARGCEDRPSPPNSGGLREIGPVARAETRRTSTRSGRDDSPGRVSIFPLYGLGRPVVLFYIRHELVRQIFHRSENAARDDGTLNLGKPQLDLIQP